MDSSEVGKYGTLRLMKRLEPDKAVASYPIDDEEITFGRDPSSSIRLYYDSVSAVHCKIVFHDRKVGTHVCLQPPHRLISCKGIPHRARYERSLCRRLPRIPCAVT